MTHWTLKHMTAVGYMTRQIDDSELMMMLRDYADAVWFDPYGNLSFKVSIADGRQQWFHVVANK